MLSFWNETLKNISQDQRKDKFIFIINKIRFEVPLSLALGISPFISEQYLKDPTYREFEIEDKEKIEEEFSNFIRGKEIREKIFIKIGRIIKNTEMLKKWKYFKGVTKEKVIENIRYLHQIEDIEKEQGAFIGDEILKEEVEYIAKHFGEMKEEIKHMRAEELIIRNENINFKNEDTIWEIFKDRMNKIKREIYEKDNNRNQEERYKKLRRILLENIEMKNLSKQNFKEYINEIEPEDILCGYSLDKKRRNIWIQIQGILLHNQIFLKEEIIHKEGKNFEGIINYIEEKYGKDLHEQGIITIDACSNPQNMKRVIDYKSNNFWQSDGKQFGWWEINFNKNKVKMNGYPLFT